jgi:hypothetical protein
MKSVSYSWKLHTRYYFILSFTESRGGEEKKLLLRTWDVSCLNTGQKTLADGLRDICQNFQTNVGIVSQIGSRELPATSSPINMSSFTFSVDHELRVHPKEDLLR